MNDIKQAVINAMDRIVASGSIEKKIEETIQKTIDSIISETFRDYSEFSKDLKKQLSEKIKIDLDKIDLPTYNAMIENAIKTRINDTMTAESQELINKNLDAILKIEEKDWSLSKFIEEFKKSLQEYDGEKAGDKITCIVEQSKYNANAYHIYIDEYAKREKYHCKIRLFVSDSVIKSVDFDGEKWEKDVFLGWKQSLEATLFRIYAQGKRFVIDEENVDINFPDND